MGRRQSRAPSTDRRCFVDRRSPHASYPIGAERSTGGNRVTRRTFDHTADSGQTSVRGIAMSVAVIDAALEPLALSPANAARFLSISKRSLSRLIAAKKIEARKDGPPRTLVDVASLKAYYARLPKRTDHASI